MGKPEGKRSLGRLRGRLEGNIKIHFKEIGWTGMNLVYLAENWVKCLALVNTIMKLQVLFSCGEYFTTWRTINFLSRTPLCGVN
jgi:hypothetical protein